MPNDQMQQLNHQPLTLLRNIRYPTYQLYALAGCGKVSPEAVLTIAVLETFHWLRQRFREFDLPPELDWPDASQYAAVDCTNFQTFLLDEGYKVEVIWLPDEKIWTLQLTEPDLGPQPGAEKQTRPPVPGRLYETNIAYRIIGEKLVCGFRTVVAEPKGTAEPSEVYRLAVIKRLIQNPLVGLQQSWGLQDEANPLSTVNAIKRLREWLRDPARMMPVVIAAERESSQMTVDKMPSIQDLIARQTLAKAFSFDLPPEAIPAVQENQRYSIDIQYLAKHRMSYALFFTLPFANISAFHKTADIPISSGDIIIVEPFVFGSKIKSYSFKTIEANPNEITQQIDLFITNYLRSKPISFDKAVFLPEAKVIYQKQLLDMHHTKAEIIRSAQITEEAINRRHKDETDDKLEELRLSNEKNVRLTRQMQILEENIRLQETKMQELRLNHQLDLAKKDSEMMRLQSLKCRPNTPAEVSGWVSQSFAGRLHFHQRASELMAAVTIGEVDMQLLCDALEFLATEYRDELLELISEEELCNICSKKYNRPFDVTPLTGNSVVHYPHEYKIKYYTGPNGKLTESLLNLHLKVGNAADNLLRIYFLYDKTKQLIVVGSLPRHLKTESYK